MPRPALRIEAPQLGESFRPTETPASEPPRLRNADAQDRPAPSLPVALQREVARAVAEGSFDARARNADGKWSPRQTLAFILATCSAFWAAFAWIMTKLF